MNYTFGIRKEDMYPLERRSPLTPSQVEYLIKEEKLEAVVEKTPQRVFSHEEYIRAGATARETLDQVPVVFGIKEVPLEQLRRETTYVFFAHVIKGQPHNMPMLKRMMELGCNLIDYEKVQDEQGKRMIYFGHYAGVAGMINTLHALGLRLKHKGYTTPLLNIQQTHHYKSLDQAKEAISQVGHEIAGQGMPAGLEPLTIGFTGYGNVSKGAQEILCLLPVKEITPNELLTLQKRNNHPRNVFYKVVFKEKHLVENRNPEKGFELEDYYQNPHKYQSVFEQYTPHLSVLVNGMYWDESYPKLITKSHLEELFSGKEPRLMVIGDITCDVDGSVESTVKATEIKDPCYVYNPFTRDIQMGYQGEGLLTMAVDILPSELPREASQAFGNTLLEFVPPIVTADYDAGFMELNLPEPIKKALILFKGALTPDYTYLEEYLEKT